MLPLGAFKGPQSKGQLKGKTRRGSGASRPKAPGRKKNKPPRHNCNRFQFGGINRKGKRNQKGVPSWRQEYKIESSAVRAKRRASVWGAWGGKTGMISRRIDWNLFLGSEDSLFVGRGKFRKARRVELENLGLL